MKKYFAIFSAALFCVCICAVLTVGYRWFLSGPVVAMDNKPPDVLVQMQPSPYYSSKSTNRGLNALTTDDQRAVYHAILRRIASVTDEPTGDKYTNSSGYFMERVYAPRLGAQELAMVIDCVREDYPEAFWLTGNCRHGTNENGQYFIQPISYLSPKELDSAIVDFNQNVSAVLLSVPKGLSEFERELFMHDWLVEHCEYDTKGYDADKNDIFTGSAYGAFVGGQTVCEGYARGFHLLLKMVGIESTLITGTSSSPLGAAGRAHIWNAVNIDGEWYQTDVTWDDSREVENSHDYLNLTTQRMSADHHFDPVFSLKEGQTSSESDDYFSRFNRLLPECTATEMNYYNQKSVAIDTKSQFSIDKIAQELVKACQRGDSNISVIFTNEETRESCQKWLTQFAFFQSARDANVMLGQKVFRESEVYFVRSETLENVLMFQLPLEE